MDQTRADDILEKMLDEISFLTKKYTLGYTKNEADLLALAVAYQTEAKRIFTAVGGADYAASVLYRIADRAVTDKQKDK